MHNKLDFSVLLGTVRHISIILRFLLILSSGKKVTNYFHHTNSCQKYCRPEEEETAPCLNNEIEHSFYAVLIILEISGSYIKKEDSEKNLGMSKLPSGC